MLGSQGKPELAEQAARQAVKLEPGSARNRLILGYTLMFQGKLEAAETEMREAQQLDVLLYRSNGTYIGVLARVRDLLPGTYSFAITGRGPGGAVLGVGGYELRLVAWPTLPGKPSRARIRFRIE